MMILSIKGRKTVQMNTTMFECIIVPSLNNEIALINHIYAGSVSLATVKPGYYQTYRVNKLLKHYLLYNVM